MFGYTNAWWMGKVRHTPRAAARPVPCAYPAPVVLPSLEVLPHTCACVQTPGWDDSVPYLTWADGEWQLPAIVGNPVTPRVRADDRNVRIIGRFLPTPIGAAFDHPGVQITTHVQGTRSVSIALSQAGAASHGTVTLSLLHRFVVFVDGVRHEGPVSFTTKNWPLHTTCVVPIASGLDPNKAHEIVVLKVSEAQFEAPGHGWSPNYLTLHGFDGDEGMRSVALSSAKPRRVEFLGDSLTAGWCAFAMHASRMPCWPHIHAEPVH